MIFETAVIIGFACLLVLVAIQASQISKLNRLKDVCFKQLDEKTDRWKYEHLEIKIESLDKQSEFLLQELNAADTKTFKDIENAKDQLRNELNVVQDQLRALTNELGYVISKTPSTYQVIKKVL